MKINVILITYKQEDYIRQTVESLLAQELEYPIEVVVADDCSPDKTLDIIKEYAENAPDRFAFKILESERNLGYVRNYKRAFEACDGEYIAILEGDDYWTRPNHIQNHVQFLEEQPLYTVSFNRHVRFFQDEDRTEIFDWENEELEYETITTSKLALGNRIGNLSCSVFRTSLIKRLKPEAYDIEFADWFLGMFMGQFGPLAYQKEVTSLYRIHNKGQWSRMTEVEQGEAIKEAIVSYDRLLDYKYTKEFAQHTKRINAVLYGDKSFKGRIKQITPEFVKNIYRNLRR